MHDTLTPGHTGAKERGRQARKKHGDGGGGKHKKSKYAS